MIKSDGKPTKIRTRGAIPPTYQGRVYWRLVAWNFVGNALAGEPIEFLEPKDKLLRLFIDRAKMPDKTINTPGLVLDEAGALLPEWRVPLRARWKKDKVRVEFGLGQPPYLSHVNTSSIRMSQRVYDALQMFDPDIHPAVPIDIECLDGTVERRWQVFTRRSLFADHALHPVANDLEPITYYNGESGFKYPSWLGRWREDGHFGFLDGKLIGERHWFGAMYGHYLSSEFFETIRLFGDIIPHHFMALPIGVAE